jgi:TPR repeat protein
MPLQKGQGVPRDIKLAEKYLWMAGQKGSGKAWCELGDLYGYTSLVPDGIGEAITCYQKATARASLKDLKIWVDVIFLHGESRLTPPRDWS